MLWNFTPGVMESKHPTKAIYNIFIFYYITINLFNIKTITVERRIQWAVGICLHFLQSDKVISL